MEIRTFLVQIKTAEGFNEFFVNLGPNLANLIPESDKTFNHYLKDAVYEKFVFSNLTPEIVLESVNKLKTKNSEGKDNISSKLLKDIIESIIYPVTHLFNLLFKTGYMPSEYKCAKVGPIFKSGDKASFNNYRPISILPTFSKLLEKIAAMQMFIYLNKFDIFL